LQTRCERIGAVQQATKQLKMAEYLDIQLDLWHCIQYFDAAGWASGRASSL